MIRGRGSTGSRETRGYEIAALAALLSLVGCVATSEQTTSGTTSEPTTTPPGSTTDAQVGAPTTAEFETGDDVAGFLADLAAPTGEPIDLVPTLAEGAVTAEIGREGGSVTATGPDGTTYLLELPAEALLFPTDIILTPLADVTGFPFDAPEHRLGADLAPRGLELAREARLTITPAVSLQEMAVAALGYPGDGDNAGAEFFSEEEGSILLTLEHFSGYVVTYPVDISKLRAIARAELENQVRSFENTMAVVGAINQTRQKFGLSTYDPVTIARNFLPTFREVVLIPHLNNAALGCEEGLNAVAAWFAYWRQAQVLGVAGDDDSPGDPEFFVEFGGETLRNSFELPERLLPTVVDHCLEEAYRACVVTGDLGILYVRIASFDRTMQLLGRNLEPAWVDLLIDYAKRCGQWELTIHTEFDENVQIQSDLKVAGSGAVTRHIDLRWQPGAGVGLDRVAGRKIEGEADLELERSLYSWSGTRSCTITNTPPTQDTRARARMVDLKFEYEEPSAGSNVRRGRPVAFSLAIQLGRMNAVHTADCPLGNLLWDQSNSWFDDVQVSDVMFETGAVQPDPEAGDEFAMLIKEGWEFVGSPFRARLFKDGPGTILEGVWEVNAQLDILLTHTPQ